MLLIGIKKNKVQQKNFNNKLKQAQYISCALVNPLQFAIAICSENTKPQEAGYSAS